MNIIQLNVCLRELWMVKNTLVGKESWWEMIDLWLSYRPPSACYCVIMRGGGGLLKVSITVSILV